MKSIVKGVLLFFCFLFFGAALTVIYLSGQTSVTQIIRPIVEQPVLKSQEDTTAASEPFSLDKAPTNSVNGRITSLSGAVFWKSRVASVSAVLSPTIQIQQGEEVETKDDGQVAIEFGDGQSVIVFPKSGLNIIQTLPSNLVFQQTDGTVTYKNLSGSPLTIRSLGLITQFVNGEARIIINKKTSVVSVEAVKGSLNSAYNDLKYVTRVVNVAQGKKLTFNNVKKRVTIK